MQGKEFFRLETNVTEPIRSMFVEDSGIWTSGEYIYNQFLDGRDHYFFLSPGTTSPQKHVTHQHYRQDQRFGLR